MYISAMQSTLVMGYVLYCDKQLNTRYTGLVYNDVLGHLFTEEIHRKSVDDKKDVDAYVANERQRGRTQNRAKSKDRGGSRSKSRGSMCNVECHHCHKKGHVRKDCRAWQKSTKKDTQSSEASKSTKSDEANKGKATLEEINVLESPNAPVGRGSSRG